MKYRAYVHTKSDRGDGTYDSYLTQAVRVRCVPKPAYGETKTGYGCRLPTSYQVFWRGRWHAVRAVCYSNSATFYVGKKYTPCLTVTIQMED